MGSWAAQILHEQGGKVVAVSDVAGAVINMDGLDVPELRRHVDEFGHSLASFPDGGGRAASGCQWEGWGLGGVDGRRGD